MAKRLLALVLAAAIALSVGVTFRPQAAQAATNPVTAMSVATQPQLAYVEMNTLDLSGLSVTLIYSDTTTATVGFADLAANGVTLAYSNGWLATQGDMLTVAGFNGLTIVLTCGKVTAETGALAVTVNSAYDVNGDGKVDAADLALIMANLNKKATASAAAKKCDVNGSGTVDTLDYALVANYIAGVSGAATPEPAPTPEPDILAESIAIDPETVSLQVDETTQLMAVFTPADTTDQSVTWASSDDAKATVDADGLVTAVAATDADAPVIITATATASGLTATCEVTVTAPEPDTSEWIPVAKAMVQGDIYAVDPAGKFKLFDEYDKVVAAPPDSANPYLPPVNTGAAVNDNVWRSAGANWDVQYETYFTINFGTQCELTNIWVYDGPSYAPATYVHPDTVDKPYEVYGGQFQVWSGALDTGTLLGTVTIENVGQWKDIDLTGLNADGYLTTDTLSFRKVQDTVNNRYAWSGGNWTSDAGQYVCDVCVPEVAIKGTPLGTLTTDPVVDNDWTPTPDGRTPTVFDLDMRDLIGTNGFFTDNQDNYSPFGMIREYHNWGWTEYTAGEGNNNAQTMTGGNIAMFWNRWGSFDSYYKSLHDAGTNVVICVQGGVTGAPRDVPNWQGDQDYTNPASYLAHAQSMFQLAARYGSNKNIDLNLIQVASDTTKQVGLGYVQYYEDWNEPDATWEKLGIKQFSAEMFAAMLSADYDGHMGTMGPNVGVKQADPNAKLVMGGLAGIVTDHANDKVATQFMLDMMKWFDENRSPEKWLETHATLDGYVKYPFDVINCHNYCTNANGTTGVSPEDYDMFNRLTEYVNFSHTYFPTCEIWLSEFGWETGNTHMSPYSATAEYTDASGVHNQGINTGFTTYQVQGNWLVREYLISAAAGINRDQQYMLYNSGGTDAQDTGGQHSTDGYINAAVSSGSTDKKASWFYVSALNYWLGDTKFDTIISDGSAAVNNTCVYQFDKPNGDKAFALWQTTSHGVSTKVDYSLDVGAAANAVQVTLADGEKTGVVTPLTITDGHVDVTITEEPSFVVTSDSEIVVPQKPQKIDLTGMAITGSGDRAASLLTDDQDTVGDVLNDIPATTDWQSKGDIALSSWGYSSSADLDLGSVYHITNLVLWRFEGDNGSGLQQISVFFQEADGSWTKIIASHAPKWVDGGWFDVYDCDFVAQKIRLVSNNDIKVQEMLLYGYKTDEPIGGDSPFKHSPMIHLTTDMLTGTGDIQYLVVNEPYYGDPINDAGTNMYNLPSPENGTWTNWTNGGVDSWAQIDLGKKYDITDICIYFRGIRADMTSTQTVLKFFDDNTGTWKLVPQVNFARDEGSWMGIWNRYSGVNITTQYLRFESPDGSVNGNQIHGIALYGNETTGDGFDNIVQTPGATLLTVDFNQNNTNYAVSGVTSAIIDDPEQGKAMQMTGSGEFDLTGLASLFQPNSNYVIDWFYKVDASPDTTTKLMAVAQDWLGVYDGDGKSGGDNYSGLGDTYGQVAANLQNLSPRLGWWMMVPFQADAWNHMAMLVNVDATGIWNFRLYVNGAVTGYYSVGNTEAVSQLNWYLNSAASAYIANIQVYEGTSVKPVTPPAPTYLVNIDFDANNTGYYASSGLASSIVSDPDQGKALKVAGSGEFDLTDLTTMLQPGKNYIVDWYYKTDADPTVSTALKAVASGDYLTVYDYDDKIDGGYGAAGDVYGQADAGLVNLSPRLGWWAQVPFQAGAWNHMALKISIDAGGNWNYVLSANGVETASYSLGNAAAVDQLNWYLTGFSGEASAYIANIKVYEGTAVDTSDTKDLINPPAPGNLVTIDFDANNTGYYTSIPSTSIIADADHGKALQLTGNGEFDLTGLTNLIKPSKNYIIDWYYKVDGSPTASTALKAVAAGDYLTVYDYDTKIDGGYGTAGDKYGQVDAGLVNLSPRLGWWEQIPFQAGAWNHMALKISVDASGNWNYVLSANGVDSGSYSLGNTSPVDQLNWYLTNADSAYIADIQVYEGTAVDTSDTGALPPPSGIILPENIAVSALSSDPPAQDVLDKLIWNMGDPLNGNGTDAVNAIWGGWGTPTIIGTLYFGTEMTGFVFEFDQPYDLNAVCVDYVKNESVVPIMQYWDDGANAWVTVTEADFNTVTNTAWPYQGWTNFDNLSITTTKIRVGTPVEDANHLTGKLLGIVFYGAASGGSGGSGGGTTSVLLDLSGATVINLQGGSDPANLLNQAGFDPRTSQPEDWSTDFPGSWGAWGEDRYVLVDLGKDYTITDFYAFFKGTLTTSTCIAYGAADLTAFAPYAGQDGLETRNGVKDNWQEVFSGVGTVTDSWYGGALAAPMTVRYLVIGWDASTFNGTAPGYTDLGDVALYGYAD